MRDKCSKMAKLVRDNKITRYAFAKWFNAHIIAAGPVNTMELPEALTEDAGSVFIGIKNGSLDDEAFYVWLTDVMDEAEEYAIAEDLKDEELRWENPDVISS